MATIYMPLLNEGTDVWRPVDAALLKGETYKVEGQMDQDELWAFAAGTVVRCEWKLFGGGEARLVAVALADSMSAFDPLRTPAVTELLPGRLRSRKLGASSL